MLNVDNYYPARDMNHKTRMLEYNYRIYTRIIKELLVNKTDNEYESCKATLRIKNCFMTSI